MGKNRSSGGIVEPVSARCLLQISQPDEVLGYDAGHGHFCWITSYATPHISPHKITLNLLWLVHCT